MKWSTWSLISIFAVAVTFFGGCAQATTKTTDAIPIAVTGVTLDKAALAVATGDQIILTATVSPANATVRTVAWTSADPSIATATAGLIEAKKVGTTTISVTTSDGSKTAACSVSVSQAALNIFSMSSEFADNGVMADFEALTGAKVNLTSVANEQYLGALKALFASGAGVPDIFVGEAGFIKEVVNLGQSEDLSQPPYNASTADQYVYASQMGRDKTGVLRALTWQTTPGGLFYRRSVAKAVFGTDDPIEIGKKFATWDLLLASGKTLADQGYSLLPGVGDLSYVFYAGKKAPYFDATNTYILDPIVQTYFETAKKVRDGGLDAKLDAWSTAWMDGMNTKPGEAKIFSYLWPTWGLHFTLSGETNSQGDWAVTSTPVNWYWGGTWMNIYNKSPQKALAWRFVEMMTQDKTYMEKYAKRTGDFTSDKTVVAKIKGTFSSATLGGQNHYEFFDKTADQIDASGVSGADTVVDRLVGGVLNDYLSGKIATVADSMAEITKQVKVKFPDAIYP